MPHVQMSLKINSLLEVLLPESLIKGRCVPNWPLHITFSTFEEFSFWNWSHLQGASLHYNSICKSECKIATAPKGLKIWWINNVEKKHQHLTSLLYHPPPSKRALPLKQVKEIFTVLSFMYKVCLFTSKLLLITQINLYLDILNSAADGILFCQQKFPNKMKRARFSLGAFGNNSETFRGKVIYLGRFDT